MPEPDPYRYQTDEADRLRFAKELLCRALAELSGGHSYAFMLMHAVLHHLTVPKRLPVEKQAEAVICAAGAMVLLLGKGTTANDDVVNMVETMLLMHRKTL